MADASYPARVLVYLVTFALSFHALGAVDFQRFLKQGHVQQAQVLYALLVLALAWLSGSFVLGLLYHQ